MSKIQPVVIRYKNIIRTTCSPYKDNEINGNRTKNARIERHLQINKRKKEEKRKRHSYKKARIERHLQINNRKKEEKRKTAIVQKCSYRATSPNKQKEKRRKEKNGIRTKNARIERHLQINKGKKEEKNTCGYRGACMYVYGHAYSKSMNQPGKVAKAARGQLNRETEYFPVHVRA